MRLYNGTDLIEFVDRHEQEFIAFLWNTFKTDPLMAAKFAEAHQDLHDDWVHNTKGENTEPTRWED